MIPPISDLVTMARKRPRTDYEDPGGEMDESDPETIGDFMDDLELDSLLPIGIRVRHSKHRAK